MSLNLEFLGRARCIRLSDAGRSHGTEQWGQAGSCPGLQSQSLALKVKVVLLLCQELKMDAFILLNKLSVECNL